MPRQRQASDVNDNIEVEGGGEGGTPPPQLHTVVTALRRTQVVTSSSDKVTTAEILWVFKTVNSTLPFAVSEDIVDILQKMDPDSSVFRLMQLKRNKTMYVLTHGLYPHYLLKLIKRIQRAPGFTLGTDSATFKLQGLSKFVDIVIRCKIYFVTM